NPPTTCAPSGPSSPHEQGSTRAVFGWPPIPLIPQETTMTSPAAQWLEALYDQRQTAHEHQPAPWDRRDANTAHAPAPAPAPALAQAAGADTSLRTYGEDQ